jgi:hypothetical protein
MPALTVDNVGVYADIEPMEMDDPTPDRPTDMEPDISPIAK